MSISLPVWPMGPCVPILPKGPDKVINSAYSFSSWWSEGIHRSRVHFLWGFTISGSCGRSTPGWSLISYLILFQRSAVALSKASHQGASYPLATRFPMTTTCDVPGSSRWSQGILSGTCDKCTYVTPLNQRSRIAANLKKGIDLMGCLVGLGDFPD